MSELAIYQKQTMEILNHIDEGIHDLLIIEALKIKGQRITTPDLRDEIEETADRILASHGIRL